MQPTSDEKPRRFLNLSELARAMYGASRPPAPPDFVAEGTGVDAGVRASVPPKPRQSKAAEANPSRNAKLVLGLGVVDAKNEVAPELVRSGRLEMKNLAAAYQEDASKALAAVKSATTRDSRPTFADVLPAAAATLMLPPPTRRQRPRSGAATLLLSAVLSAALIAGTAAATLHTLRSDGGAEKARPATSASAGEPEIAKIETPPATPAPAAPLVQTPTAEQRKSSAEKPPAKKAAVRADKRGEKKSAARASKRAAPPRVASREPKPAMKRGAPAAAKSCDEHACLMNPSLACCKESAGQ